MSQDQGASSQSEDRAATPSEPSQSSVVSGVAGIPCASTPGPWGYEPCNGDWLITYGFDQHHGPRALARVFDYACEFQLGDAILIASAPKLYAALKEIAHLRPAGDIDTAKNLRPLLKQIEQIAIRAIEQVSA